MSWKNLPRSSSAPLDRQAPSSAFSVRGNERTWALSLSNAKTVIAETSAAMRNLVSKSFSVRPRECGDPERKCRNLSRLASRLRGNERRKDCSHHLLHPAPCLERR